jgi:transcriptional regulator with XRE-family HTH domain
MTKLRLLRLERDIKAKDLAVELKIDKAVLSSVEKKRTKASDRVRLKLCRYYGVEEAELFDCERYAV